MAGATGDTQLGVGHPRVARLEEAAHLQQGLRGERHSSSLHSYPCCGTPSTIHDDPEPCAPVTDCPSTSTTSPTLGSVCRYATSGYTVFWICTRSGATPTTIPTRTVAGAPARCSMI